MASPLALRPATNADAQDLFGLITLCFAEYPGCFTDPHDDMPDLVRPGHWPERRAADGRLLGGEFLVVEDARGRVCACIALDFPESGEFASEVAPGSREANSTMAKTEFASEVVPGSREANSAKQKTAELHRLYVRPDCRGRGLAKRLTQHVEALACAAGAGRMILWSDTRFTKAHALYAGLGYARGGTRPLGDISNSVEFFFEKML